MKVGDLPAQVNAIAYAPDQDLYYGIADEEIVTITAEGVLTWRGESPDDLGDANAGAIMDDEWLLTGTGGLHAIDIAPDSPTYLTTVRRVELSHWSRLADWDVSPTDGALYAVDTGGTGSASVIRIDPVTGSVTTLATPRALPGDGDYGSIVVDAELTMHAFHNPTGILFHIPLANPESVTATPLGPPARVADGARCPRLKPSPTPSPTPSPSSSPTPPPTSAPPTTVEPPPFTPTEESSHAPTSPPSESAAASPPPSPSKVLLNAPAIAHAEPDDHMATRAFLLGLLLPAIVVVARGVRRVRG